VQDIRDQRSELVCNGVLKVFARVEFEHSSLPASLTWSNYDLLLFKENFKDLYETKYLCDIVVKVVRKSATCLAINSSATTSAATTSTPPASLTNTNGSSSSSQMGTRFKKFKYSLYENSNSNNDTTPGGSQCNCSLYFNNNSSSSSFSSSSSSCDLESNNSILGNTNNGPCSSQECFCNNSNGECCSSNNTSTIPAATTTLEIKSHKFILASRSGKFRELLKTCLIRRGEALNVSNCSLLSLCANSLPTKSVLGGGATSMSNANCSPSSSSILVDKEQQLGMLTMSNSISSIRTFVLTKEKCRKLILNESRVC
jgi:hypothetical protein